MSNVDLGVEKGAEERPEKTAAEKKEKVNPQAKVQRKSQPSGEP